MTEYKMPIFGADGEVGSLAVDIREPPQRWAVRVLTGDGAKRWLMGTMATSDKASRTIYKNRHHAMGDACMMSVVEKWDCRAVRLTKCPKRDHEIELRAELEATKKALHEVGQEHLRTIEALAATELCPPKGSRGWRCEGELTKARAALAKAERLLQAFCDRFPGFSLTDEALAFLSRHP